MRINIRKQTLVKSLCYSLLFFALLLFSESFLPALCPGFAALWLLPGALAALALFEDERYAGLFAVIFGVLEECMSRGGRTVFPLLYVLFALLCAYLYTHVFVRNFLSWFCYTTAGLALCALAELFFLVARWDLPAHMLLQEVLPAFLASLPASLLLYPIFSKIKKKTTREGYA